MIHKFTKITVLSSVLATGLAAPVSAHDFWMQPDDFSLDADARAQVALRIGHADDLSLWPLAADRVIALRSVGPDGITDHQAAVERAAPDLDLDLGQGFHVLTIETQDAISELPAGKFNAYIAEEGLTPIKLDRARRSRTDTPGVERYSRRGKTLIAVGDVATRDDRHILRPVGMTLELVPLKNPFRLAPGDVLPVRLHYRGKAQPGVRVKHIRLDENETRDSLVSDADGLINVTLPEAGDWMLHAVWAAPLPARSDQDYDTIFSSLSYSARK